MNKIELDDLLADTGVIKKDFVKVEDITNEIKDTITVMDGYNYIFDNEGMTNEELKLALLAKQTNYIKSIKSMVTFFVVLAIASFILSLIAIL